MGITQLTRSVRGNKRSMVVTRLALHLFLLEDAGRLGGLRLATWEGHGVQVTLVGAREAPVLARSLLPGQARTHRTLRRGDLGGSVRILGGTRLAGLRGSLHRIRKSHVFGDKLLTRKVVVNCDAAQKGLGVSDESGSKYNTKAIHLVCFVEFGLVNMGGTYE
jgi:hypothetical protein